MGKQKSHSQIRLSISSFIFVLAAQRSLEEWHEGDPTLQFSALLWFSEGLTIAACGSIVERSTLRVRADQDGRLLVVSEIPGQRILHHKAERQRRAERVR